MDNDIIQSRIGNYHSILINAFFSLLPISFRCFGFSRNALPTRLFITCLIVIVTYALVPHISYANMTMDKAIEKALANNPNLQAKHNKIEVATGGMIQARLWPNPECAPFYRKAAWYKLDGRKRCSPCSWGVSPLTNNKMTRWSSYGARTRLSRFFMEKERIRFCTVP